MKPYEVVQGVTAVPSPRVDGYVVGMTVEVVDSAGRVQTDARRDAPPRRLRQGARPRLHVRQFHDYDRRPSALPAERFFGAGEEHMELALPDGYGYPNRASGHLGARLHADEPPQRARRRCTCSTACQYVTGEPRTAVKPVWLDVVNCYADPVFTVPARAARARRFTRTSDFTMPESGRLVSGGGHVHGGGTAARAPQRDLRQPRALHVAAELAGTVSATDDARARPDAHDVVVRRRRHPGRRGRDAAAARRLRQQQAAHARDGDHDRVPRPEPGLRAPGRRPRSPIRCTTPAPPPRVVQPLLRRPAGTVARVRETGSRTSASGTSASSLAQDDLPLALPRPGPPRRHARERPRGPRLQLGDAGAVAFRFRRPGTYNLYCSLHPTLMTQRVIVR